MEAEERPELAVHGLAGRADPHGALDDAEPRVFLHLVVAERLARLQLEQDCAGLVVGVQDDRISLAVGYLDLRELPGLHDPQG